MQQCSKCTNHAERDFTFYISVRQGGEPWCAQLLRHPGVLAFKATIPQDSSGLSSTD